MVILNIVKSNIEIDSFYSPRKKTDFSTSSAFYILIKTYISSIFVMVY